MVSGCPEESQGDIELSVGIGPAVCPSVLGSAPVPLQGKLSLFVPKRCLDTDLPDIVPVNDMVHDLPHRPPALRWKGIQLVVVETGDRLLQRCRALKISGEQRAPVFL